VLIAIWRTVAGHVSRAAVDARAARIAVERELFGGRYTYSSKNDDDLPAVTLAGHGRSRSSPQGPKRYVRCATRFRMFLSRHAGPGPRI
jgi:hypothetical protein